MPEKFWVDDFTVLFTNIQFFPLSSMTKDEKLNALTRLVIIIGIALYVMKYEHYLTFITVSIIVILLLKYGGGAIKSQEGFSIVPTYANPNVSETTVAPLFSEEWQINPQQTDLYENIPDVEGNKYLEPLTPQSYPFSQFMSRTNLLPSDEYATHMLNGGQRQARSYVNGSFLRHELAYRDNISRIYKKKLARRFAQNSNDVFSSYSSY